MSETARPGRLDGKVALITGGSMGMGAAHVRGLVAEGARVMIADIAEARGRDLAASLGDSAAFVSLDVTDAEQWRAAVEATVSRFGGLNVLLNNAGIFHAGSIAETTREQWDRTLAINLTAAFLGLQAALPALQRGTPSSVINVSSTAGIESYGGQAAYSASKWGLRGLTRSAALDLAEDGIRVNSIHPGGVATPLIEAFRTLSEEDTVGSTLSRFARPEEITGLVVYLASDEASFVTGAEIVIDGGITAGQAAV
ncbi:glucose 1-dehydrogenase [Leucobacter sp. M11]|uniref:glucose 1-dehydrogenase n=1 Tax=Leucobacter sp. M11 TaxID=2993565 RepID=UPI002D7E5FE0|nr:glucose 1-dehydrogenase [Leucobacter sp. M11]MEB4616417.1 glucose 1-dehydrogenase [Leucobacter sp. M11]